MNEYVRLIRDYYKTENRSKRLAIARALHKRLLPSVRERLPFPMSSPVYSNYNNGIHLPLRPKPEALPIDPLPTDFQTRIDGSVIYPERREPGHKGIDIPLEEGSSGALAFIQWSVIGIDLYDEMEEAHAACAKLVDFESDNASLVKLRAFRDSAEEVCEKIRVSLEGILSTMAAELELFVFIATAGRTIDTIPSRAELGETFPFASGGSLHFALDENYQLVESGARMIKRACDEFGAAAALCGWVRHYLWHTYAVSRENGGLRPSCDSITKAFGEALDLPQTYRARVMIELSLLRKIYFESAIKEMKARARYLAADVLIQRTVEAGSLKLGDLSTIWDQKPKGSAKLTLQQKEMLLRRYWNLRRKNDLPLREVEAVCVEWLEEEKGIVITQRTLRRWVGDDLKRN